MKENIPFEKKLELVSLLRSESRQNQASIRHRENIIKGNGSLGTSNNAETEDSILFIRQLGISLLLRIAIASLLVCGYWYCSNNNLSLFNISTNEIASYILTEENHFSFQDIN